MNTSHPPHRSVQQGRRPSVEPTTARRCPSARRRPGAGFLPAWPPAARVVRRCMAKERFRVYSEDEFFARGEQIAKAMGRDDAVGSASVPAFQSSLAGAAVGARGLRMALGTGLVAGAGALGLAVVVYMLSPAAHVRRKAVLRAGRANALATAAAKPPAALRVAQRARPRAVRRQARRDHAATPGASASDRRAVQAPIRHTAMTRPVSAVSLSPARRSSGSPRVVARGPSSPAGGSTDVDVRARPEVVAASNGSASPQGEGEFGFEQ